MEEFFPIGKTDVKKGLVLGGGGAKGSYAAGVVTALDEMGAVFDLVTGTSVGAICGSLYVQESASKIDQWISTLGNQSIADNLFLFPNQYTIDSSPDLDANAFFKEFTQNGPSIVPLRDHLAEIFDYKAFMNSKMDFACLSYNLSKNRPQPFYKKDMTENDVLDKILSSTAYFPAFNMIEIDGDYLIDGGYAQTVPYDLAESMGAQKLLAVDLSNPGEAAPFEDDEDHKIIRPLLQLCYFLDFEPQAMKNQVAQGYLETLKYFNEAPGYLYTFYAEDWSHMKHLEELVLEVLVAKGKAGLLEKMPSIMDRIYQFLLGYIPQPLNNAYSEEYIFGRILEAMGLIAGISPYQQYHFRDFFHQILEHFESFTSNPNTIQDPQKMYHHMEIKGLHDLIVFFRSALKSFADDLPPAFEAIEEKFLLPYYLAWGWILMERFKLVFYL